MYKVNQFYLETFQVSQNSIRRRNPLTQLLINIMRGTKIYYYFSQTTLLSISSCIAPVAQRGGIYLQKSSDILPPKGKIIVGSQCRAQLIRRVNCALCLTKNPIPFKKNLANSAHLTSRLPLGCSELHGYGLKQANEHVELTRKHLQDSNSSGTA